MVRAVFRFFYILCVLLVLEGCVDIASTGNRITGPNSSFFAPKPLFMANLPDGDDSYSQGFRDGCTTALGIIGNGMLRMYGFNYDVNRGIEDKDYYRGYQAGFNYGTYYTDVDPL